MGSFLVGVAFGALGLFAYAGVSYEIDRSSCARQHNVYTCKFVANFVPITDPVRDPPSP